MKTSELVMTGCFLGVFWFKPSQIRIFRVWHGVQEYLAYDREVTMW